MAFVPVPNTVMVESIYEWNGQVVENTAYFEFTPGAPTAGDVLDLLNEIRTVIQEELMPLLNETIALVRLVGTLLTAIDSLSTTLNVSPPFAGSSAGESLPNNVTYCISFITNARGRSFRGRNYVPGLGNGQVDGNNIVSTTRTALLAYYSTLKAAVSELSWEMVVVSRFEDGVARTTGVTTPITTFTTFDTVVDSQRRRLPGRGS